jgi:hypothetical protein
MFGMTAAKIATTIPTASPIFRIRCHGRARRAVPFPLVIAMSPRLRSASRGPGRTFPGGRSVTPPEAGISSEWETGASAPRASGSGVEAM